MKLPMRIAATALAVSVVCPVVANEEAVAKAREAAQSWLSLTDARNGAGSWQSAATLFRAGVPKDRWEQLLAAARGPLGELKKRSFKSATYATALPGAPDGEYVVIQYATQFANKASAIETVTPMREKDGSWKVSGYFIK